MIRTHRRILVRSFLLLIPKFYSSILLFPFGDFRAVTTKAQGPINAVMMRRSPSDADFPTTNQGIHRLEPEHHRSSPHPNPRFGDDRPAKTQGTEEGRVGSRGNQPRRVCSDAPTSAVPCAAFRYGSVSVVGGSAKEAASPLSLCPLLTTLPYSWPFGCLRYLS